MKYDVKKAEKAGEKEYEVSVEIQPVDLFLNYVKELEQASDEIEESAKNGGYEGTEEEIREMMQYDYLSRRTAFYRTPIPRCNTENRKP